jgi:hypothetical protein
VERFAEQLHRVDSEGTDTVLDANDRIEGVSSKTQIGGVHGEEVARVFWCGQASRQRQAGSGGVDPHDMVDTLYEFENNTPVPASEFQDSVVGSEATDHVSYFRREMLLHARWRNCVTLTQSRSRKIVGVVPHFRTSGRLTNSIAFY